MFADLKLNGKIWDNWSQSIFDDNSEHVLLLVASDFLHVKNHTASFYRAGVRVLKNFRGTETKSKVKCLKIVL